MMNMKRIVTNRRSDLMCLAVAIACATTSTARGQCQYDVTAVFGAPGVSVSVWGMNRHGHMVGYLSSYGPNRAFLWTPEDGLVTLPHWPGASESRAHDINDAGDIVGYMQQPDSNRYTACLWKDGEPMDLGYLPDGNRSAAYSISNEGQIVGYSHNSGHGPYRAVLWEDGEMVDLSVVLGSEESIAYAINDRGWITGKMGPSMTTEYSPFVLKDGEVLDLGLLPAGVTAYGSGISDRGWVVGAGTVDTGLSMPLEVRAIAFRGANLADLGHLPGDARGRARAINSKGQIVGSSDDGGWVYRAVLWHGDSPIDLNELIPQRSSLSLSNSRGINDRGQIAASGLDESQDLVGILLSPHDDVTGDLDGDCTVDIDDIFAVLWSWGPCEGCPEDLNQDGTVDTQDLLIVIMNWR